MDGLAIKELERINLERVQVREGDMLYSGKQLYPVYFEPRPAAIVLHTLSGLVDFVNDNVDDSILSSSMIVVNSPVSATFMSRIDGVERKRDFIAEVTIDPALKTYEFGKYLEVEFFIVALRSMFETSPDIEKLIKYVSKVQGGGAFELSDDGVSQTASVKVGVSGALTAKETAPAIVKLRPYRTFRDIQQTESEFLFRMKLINESAQVVGCCLYEADGGRWRNIATSSIADFLRERLADNGPAVIA